MLPIFDSLREITIAAVVVKIVLSVVCGGIIGIEREMKRRPAGFRTHVIVCLGAAITTSTGQFLFSYMHYYTDMARFGAQVIAGIGFIGAGTIIARREKVKGLTTAAGLWTDAIIGLAIGAGFYEGALVATGLILLSEIFLSKIEYKILAAAPEIGLYIEYDDKTTLQNILEFFKTEYLIVENMEITRAEASAKHNACVVFNIIIRNRYNVEEMIYRLNQMPGVSLVEEL